MEHRAGRPHVASQVKIEDVYPKCGCLEKFMINMHRLPQQHTIYCHTEHPTGGGSYTLNDTRPVYNVRITLETWVEYGLPEFHIEWTEVGQTRILA